jgi:AraC-like DNA-binding protein
MNLVFHLTGKESPLLSNLQGIQDSSLFKLVFIEKGEGFYQTNHRTISVIPGDLFLIAPNEAYDIGGLQATDRWIVFFDSSNFGLDAETNPVLLKLNNELPLLLFLTSKHSEMRHFHVSSADRYRWVTWLRQLEGELCDRRLGFVDMAQSLLMLVIIEFIRLAKPQLQNYSLQWRPLLVEVFRFIEANYSEPISLCDVAKAVGRSSAYLTDLVRRETGKTVLSWIVECRMANACRLLIYTDRSVTQIAESVGYFDRRHFSRQFLQFHNVPPEAWRQAQFHYRLNPKLAKKTEEFVSSVSEKTTSLVTEAA